MKKKYVTAMLSLGDTHTQAEASDVVHHYYHSSMCMYRREMGKDISKRETYKTCRQINCVDNAPKDADWWWWWWYTVIMMTIDVHSRADVQT